MAKTSIIFDLDGVIVDTAKFHFLAWKNLANSIDINFTEQENEQLKGVSRIKSLEKILQWGNKKLSQDEFDRLMHQKNTEYLTFVDQMTEDDILPEVKPTLDFLKSKGTPIALGSASKNAKRILKQVNLTHYFDAIVDGTVVTKAKPDPQVFVTAAKQLNSKPQNCIVFEDSVAGVQAANAAEMLSVGIGKTPVLGEANYVFSDFTEISQNFLEKLLNQ
ncbi:beta-phosphoglucomutase [Psychroflexus sp. ALD_RP9]|uniref:beta-phosphoglucomutase n=1 Tax=Psychroflexus sp. ALD_RP9 TaxID=2777186 RepID=UPI001A8E79B7|nr:beta-phosphoglucomutase [Psychroflexus sp. ALD_RP9]QSS97287.1 beta-phosphoglucomutase [Psychroflexus sp. ALD_RP9]